MYGLDNNGPTKKHTSPNFVKQAFTTKILFHSTDNLLIIINIRKTRLKSLLISNSDLISPTNVGRCLRILNYKPCSDLIGLTKKITPPP